MTAGDNARLEAEAGFFERELIPGHSRASGMSLGFLIFAQDSHLYFNATNERSFECFGEYTRDVFVFYILASSPRE